MTGMNEVAAYLIKRKLGSFWPTAKVEVFGEDMDYRVKYEICGLSGVIEGYPQWLEVKSKIVKRLRW